MAEVVFTCKNCGGNLEFSPGVQSLKCQYCGTINENQNEPRPEIYEELDFTRAVASLKDNAETEMVQMVTCPACSAEVTLAPNETTGECDYCGTHLVAKGEGRSSLKPQYLLPFKIEKEEAKKIFKEWLKKRKFAPNALKKLARISQPLKGIYYPYWTYDAKTESSYRGERGIYYYVTVESKDSEGNTVSRQERRTRWSPVNGRVKESFDDILIPASSTAKQKLVKKLGGWQLYRMVNYADHYLSGFKAESYSLGLEDGFSEAKEIMNDEIRKDVRHDIGGDEQRIHSINTTYDDVTFKYVLLPIWILMYKFKKKFYQVIINGAGGEIEGERPYSWIKITLLVLGILAVIGAIGAAIYFYR